MTTIIGLCGSLRRGSFNRMLLRAAAEASHGSHAGAPGTHAASATVTITNQQTDRQESVTTDLEGRYTSLPLAPGQYRIGRREVANFLIASAQMMPESGYAFRPTPDVRNFGEQINHATATNYSFCNQGGVPPGFERRTANLKGVTSKEAIVKALEDSIAYCTSLLAAASDAWLMEPASNLGGTGSGLFSGMRVYAFIYAGVHSAEDYGTITTYLRMQGLVPPSTAVSRVPAKAGQ